jgi:hypothetical protein
MSAARRIRVELTPVDPAALATIADLVNEDAAGSAEFGGFYGRAPERLAPLLGDDRRAWTIRVDGAAAGFLDADLVDDVVHLSYFVVAAQRGRGVASAAVGRFLGMRVWPGAGRISAAVSPGNAASRGVLARVGFVVVGTNAHDEEVWERSAPPPTRTGVARFLDREGRIERYPIAGAERRMLLQWVIDRALPTDAVVDEAEVNTRLAPFTDDVALLRRQLVDHELLERTASGSHYARVTAPGTITPSSGPARA